jgi:hypothetical protein
MSERMSNQQPEPAPDFAAETAEKIVGDHFRIRDIYPASHTVLVCVAAGVRAGHAKGYADGLRRAAEILRDKASDVGNGEWDWSCGDIADAIEREAATEKNT